MGAIGSFTTLSLAKMGCGNLHIWDDDSVADHNLPNQFFREQDLCINKCEAMRMIVKEFTGVGLAFHPHFFGDNKEEDSKIEGIVIFAVDHLSTRKKMWINFIKKNRMKIPLMIDGRMGARVGMLFSIIPSRAEDGRYYESTLFPKEEVFEAPCTERAIIYTPLAMASAICNQVVRFLTGETYDRLLVFDYYNNEVLKNPPL